MRERRYLWAASTVALLSTLGGASALFGACSPNNNYVTDAAGSDVIVCDPTSKDPAGCACDPTTVQQVDCYDGPPGTSGKGICQSGIRKCTPQGSWTECIGEVTPQPEVCNLADDDCNGIADDLFNDAAVLAVCNSPACTGLNADASIKCWGPDPGICGAGTPTCVTGTKSGIEGCVEFIHTGAAEVCNGIDDDCNGIIDDGLDQGGACDMDDGSVWPADANPFAEAGADAGGGITKIFGECLHGSLTCVDTNCDERVCHDAGNQCFPSQPGTETCNGKDDDCNNVVDDHACATNYYKFCCHSGSYYGCLPSYYTQYGYTCVDAGP
jgi:hypothetical protein